VTDPLLSLAFSVYSNKGVFALLLGSGTSRSARIPTGWEIVVDLIRKLAALKKESPDPDPVAWYRQAFGSEPDYSALLNSIGHSPTERQHLLKPYFEPNEDERREGIKMPTAGHHAIANLVAAGNLRVIITTNFDRLVERALELEGINPIVISTPDTVKGAPPLGHLQCVVIKPNGDYLDSRVKNTASELASYAKPMQRLLEQVFDDYGLIICGWSADWDTAMRSLIESCPNRRFTTYWAVRSDLSQSARKLATARQAEIIRIRDADTFFADLNEKVRSLESLDVRHPLSAKAATVTVKRYVESGTRIRLHDLVIEETRKLCATLTQENFPQGTRSTKEERYSRCRRLEALSEILVAVLPTLVFWGEPYVNAWTTKSIEMAGSAWQTTSGPIYPEWSRVCRYPALLMIFAAGLAALSSQKFTALREFLTSPIYHDNFGQSEPLVFLLPVGSVSSRKSQQTGQADDDLFLGYHVQLLLRPHFQELIPDDRDYVSTFHLFEYILGLVISDLSNGSQWWPTWFSLGRIMSESPSDVLDKQIAKLGSDMPLLRAGFFGGSLDRLKEIKTKLDEKLAANAFGVW
jgi:hypothetical protein